MTAWPPGRLGVVAARWFVLTITVVGCDARDVVVFEGDAAPGEPAGMGGVAVEAGASGGTMAGGSAGSTSGGSGGATSGGATPSSGGATASGGEAASGGQSSGAPCRTTADCASTATCDKPDCFASGGSCVDIPVFCPQDLDPYCGCDGNTYWNDCVRLQNRIPSSTQGECRSNARRCFAPSDCGTQNVACAALLPPNLQCGPPPISCWVLPLDGCTQSHDRKRWQRCVPPSPTPSGPCVDTCTAIQSLGIYAPAPSNACQ